MKLNLEKKTIRELLCVIAVFFAASLVLYGYFIFFTKGGMTTVYKNWDGPNYVVVAKSLYDPAIIQKVNAIGMSTTDFADQFPLFPLLIRLFSFMGYHASMIFVTQVSSLLFTITLYFFLKKYAPEANALIVAILSIFYTPRWFIVSRVGSTEPLFLFLMLLFLMAFLKKKYLQSALFGALCTLTKPTGMYLFAGLLAYEAYEVVARKKSFIRSMNETMPFLLMPLSVVAIYMVYYFRFGDFFAYFHSGIIVHDNVYRLPPFAIFTELVGYYFNVWKEWIIWQFVAYLLTIVVLFQKNQRFLAFTGLLLYIPLLFMVHGDISRYALPLFPLVAIAAANILSKKTVSIALFLMIPTIYIFAIDYISHNMAGSL